MKKEIKKIYYPNGQIKEECTVIYGRLHGVAILYNEDGSVKEKRIYENDLLMGNPFKGLSPNRLAENLGMFIVDEEEWFLNKNNDEDIIEIDEKFVSIIKL